MIRKLIAACLLPAVLSGCGTQLASQLGTGLVTTQLPGSLAPLFGIPAATISIQFAQELAGIQTVAAQLQMLKAQLDGNIPVVATPPIPTPAIVNPLPTPVSAPPTAAPAPSPSPMPVPTVPMPQPPPPSPPAGSNSPATLP